jgi:hypothetical protein
MGRNKGKAFERRIAKDILKAFPNFRPKDCYRTPMSGGHPFADSGDLCVSPSLQKLFPFVCECKHYRSFSLRDLLPPTKQFQSWIGQARGAAAKMHRPWLLIVRGNNTPIYAVAGAGFKPVRQLADGNREGTTVLHHSWWMTLAGPTGRCYLISRWPDFLTWWKGI